MVRVQDADLDDRRDSPVLAWAADQDRVLITHDRKTVPRFAVERVAAKKKMPSVFLVSDQMSKGQAIEEFLIALHCLSPQECQDRVSFFPL